jgi:hypothetical protein
MSVRILKDVEEALLREFRNILYSAYRTETYEILQSSFDPFTGEKITGAHLEGHFFDSSANGRNIEYPHVFIKIARSDEDRTSGRIVPPYGFEVNTPIPWATRAYTAVTSGADLIVTSENTVTTSNLKIKLIQVGNLLQILNGPNVGTYIITEIALDGNGPHVIELSQSLVVNMPASSFDLCKKTLTFLSPVDLTSVAVGDIYTDSLGATFTISSICLPDNSLGLETTGAIPSLLSGSFISRPVLLPVSDPDNYRNFLILDPTQPIVGRGLSDPNCRNTEKVLRSDWAIPLDLIFSIIVDTKNRNDHVAVYQRIWEEFNPPRRGLGILVRNLISAESLLACNIQGSSSNQIKIQNTKPFIVGEDVRIFNKLNLGFVTQITGINSDTNTLMLADPVPCEYTVENGTSVLSNADLVVWEWDNISHRDNSNDGSHYWSHAYEYRVQVWVDKKDGKEIVGVVKQIEADIEDLSGNPISSIKVP